MEKVLTTVTSPISTGGYEGFYGLRECPFELAPDPRMVFDSQSYLTTLDDTLLAIQANVPLVIVTGDIGAGKTLYCRTLAFRLPGDALLLEFPSPPSSSEEFLGRFADDLGALVGVSSTLPDTSRRALLAQCRGILERLSTGTTALVVVDDAHELPLELLDDIHELLSVSTSETCRLQVILVGRPELETLLERPEAGPLAQYETRRLGLRPLQDDEIARYVDRRLWVAQDGAAVCLTDTADSSPEGGIRVGNTGEPFWHVRFAASAIRGVTLLSDGIPLLVNLLCDRALQSGLAHRKRRIGTRQVLAAARDLHLPVPLGLRFAGTAKYFVLLVVCVSVAVGAWRVNILSASGSADVRIPEIETPLQPAAPILEVVGPLEETDGFLIAVARFQTEAAAASVIDRLLELGLPAFGHATGAGRQQVVVGPYVSLEEADDARQRLFVENLSVSEIISVSSTIEE